MKFTAISDTYCTYCSDTVVFYNTSKELNTRVSYSPPVIEAKENDR